MDPSLSEIKSKARANQKKFKSVFNKLGRLKKNNADTLVNETHDAVFACTDCLECANCCRTTGPLFTKKDISRISKFLNISEGEFELKFLKIDEDEDFVLQSTPCSFLNLENNACSIYDVRPDACASYPHTDMRNQLKIKNLTLQNSNICPAVFNILEKLDQSLK